MPDFLHSLLTLLQASPLGHIVRTAGYLPPCLKPSTSSRSLYSSALHSPSTCVCWAFGRELSRHNGRPRLAAHFAYRSGIAVLTGLALLSAQPPVVASAGAARWKFGLPLLALLNVPVSHLGIYRNVDQWADASVTPLAVCSPTRDPRMADQRSHWAPQYQEAIRSDDDPADAQTFRLFVFRTKPEGINKC